MKTSFKHIIQSASKRLIFAFSLLIMICANGCANKDLFDGIPDCESRPVVIDELVVKIQLHWDSIPATKDPTQGFFVDVFSENPSYPDYGHVLMPPSDIYYCQLDSGNFYNGGAYNYYDPVNINFLSEGSRDGRAIVSSVNIPTYVTLQNTGKVPKEPLIAEPGNFYGTHYEHFHVVRPPSGSDTVPLDLYPKPLLREFTYCVRGVKGGQYINQTRGGFSGVASECYLTNDSIARMATLMFDGVQAVKVDSTYNLTGRFMTFLPLNIYSQTSEWFTLEVLSLTQTYYYGTWNVIGQVRESLENRPAKIARDGYDILIDNDQIGPITPGGGGGDDGSGSGFVVGVDEWGETTPIPVK
jgi:hypothetical protein